VNLQISQINGYARIWPTANPRIHVDRVQGCLAQPLVNICYSYIHFTGSPHFDAEWYVSEGGLSIGTTVGRLPATGRSRFAEIIILNRIK